AAELDAGTAEPVAGGPLGLVDRAPARVEHPPNAPLVEQGVHVACARVRPPQPSRLRVGEEQLDRLGRVLLVRADHARRAALDPAGAVDAGLDATTLVRDRAARGVEPHARQLD